MAVRAVRPLPRTRAFARTGRPRTTATKVMLEITHVISAALIIAAIAAHLPLRKVRDDDDAA